MSDSSVLTYPHLPRRSELGAKEGRNKVDSKRGRKRDRMRQKEKPTDVQHTEHVMLHTLSLSFIMNKTERRVKRYGQNEEGTEKWLRVIEKKERDFPAVPRNRERRGRLMHHHLIRSRVGSQRMHRNTLSAVAGKEAIRQHHHLQHCHTRPTPAWVPPTWCCMPHVRLRWCNASPTRP